jgi:hypothetical protein
MEPRHFAVKLRNLCAYLTTTFPKLVGPLIKLHDLGQKLVTNVLPAQTTPLTTIATITSVAAGAGCVIVSCIRFFTLFFPLSMPVLLAWMMLAPTFSKLLGPALRLSTSLLLLLRTPLLLSVSAVRHESPFRGLVDERRIRFTTGFLVVTILHSALLSFRRSFLI